MSRLFTQALSHDTDILARNMEAIKKLHLTLNENVRLDFLSVIIKQLAKVNFYIVEKLE